MPSASSHKPSQLFTVRLWVEALGDGRQEYRGKVQHVVSGEAIHFRTWTTLEAFLLEKLTAPDPQKTQTHEATEHPHGNAARDDDAERTHHA